MTRPPRSGVVLGADVFCSRAHTAAAAPAVGEITAFSAGRKPVGCGRQPPPPRRTHPAGAIKSGTIATTAAETDGPVGPGTERRLIKLF